MAMTYTQRVLRWHFNFSTFVEDILAWTFCLPFTLTLALVWGITASRLFNRVPPGVLNAINNVAKQLCLFPMNCLKGMASILFIPLALIIALQKKLPGKYDSKYATNILYYAFSIANLINLILNLQYGFMMPVILIVGILLGSIPIILTAAVISGINSIYTAYLLTIFAVELASPLISMIASSSILSGIALACWLEGSQQLFSSLLAKGINTLISKVQSNLLRFRINTFQNKQDTTLEDIAVSQDLFISNSNHAFTLEELQANIENNGGLVNWYADNVAFDPEELSTLEHHKEINKYPQLKQFIQNNRAKSLNSQGTEGAISKKSLELIFNFGTALGRDPAHPEYNVKLVAAKEAFEARLKEVSPAEKDAIENLKLIGIQQGKTFKEVLGMVETGTYAGGYCKGLASSDILKTVAQLENVTKNEDNPSFWRQSVKRFATGVGHFADLN